jgi:heparanase 1
MHDFTTNVDIDTTVVLHTTDERFVSFTLDTWRMRWGTGGAAKAAGNYWRRDSAGEFIDFTDPTMVAMAKALSPAYLRIGGTSADNITYEMDADVTDHYVPSSRGSQGEVLPHATMTPEIWAQPNMFAAAVNWEVIFCLNIFEGWESGARAWSGDRAMKLIQHTQAAGYPVVAWELGNEPDLAKKDVEPEEVAAAFTDLHQKINEVRSTGAGTTAAPWIIGPDVTKAAVANSFLAGVLQAIPPCVLDIVSWHHYYIAGELNDAEAAFVGSDSVATYESYATSASLATTTVESTTTSCDATSAKPRIWMGETAGVGGATSASKDVIGKFVEVFWYADKLGVAAKNGLSVVLKQEWADTAIEGPAPSFWLALLWKRLMGLHVLQVEHQDLPATVRLYAHKDDDGRSTLLIVNLQEDSAVSISVSLQGLASIAVHEEYHLTSIDSDVSSSKVLLNGRELPSTTADMATFIQDGTVPTLSPIFSSTTDIAVDALSVVFVRF